MTGLINNLVFILVMSSLLCGYVHILCSDDSEICIQQIENILQNSTASNERNIVGSVLFDKCSNNIIESKTDFETVAKAKTISKISINEQNKISENIFQKDVSIEPVDIKNKAWKLIDTKTKLAIRPSNLLIRGNDLYFLGPETLWVCKSLASQSISASQALSHQDILEVEELITTKERPKFAESKHPKFIPAQEFLAFCFWPIHESIVILDKSGSLFEYYPQKNKFSVLFANHKTLGSPDPHYISITSDGPNILLLDTERNQIWRMPYKNAKVSKYFKDVLPWRIKAGDPNLTDAISLSYNGEVCVLKRSGIVATFLDHTKPSDKYFPKYIKIKYPTLPCPSRLIAAVNGPVLIVEKQNNRISVVDKITKQAKQYNFPQSSILSGASVGINGFWALDSDNLIWRAYEDSTAFAKDQSKSSLDKRLINLLIPVPHASLPKHSGVYPGARRLYRHGVHQGLDFFNDPGSGTKVIMNTPAIASNAGKVIRADVNYHDMTVSEYARVMNACASEQFCSESNEDLFRGCQVWLDHGNGLITKYAHLNAARSDLKVGMNIKRGETIGYIGVSGTGENRPGAIKRPHLHFEIWLDGHYLGYGLNMPETMALYENIFAKAVK